MHAVRLGYGSLHHAGAGLLPQDLEGLDALLLDPGPVTQPQVPDAPALLSQATQMLGPRFYLDSNLTVLAGIGSADPRKAVVEIAQQLATSGGVGMPVGVVRGQDVTGRLDELLDQTALPHAETGQPFEEVPLPVRTAIAQFGAEPLLAALAQDARLVIAGAESPADMAEAAVANRFGFEDAAWRAAARAAGEGLASQFADRVLQSAGAADLTQLAGPAAVVPIEGAAWLEAPTGNQVDLPVPEEPHDNTVLVTLGCELGMSATVWVTAQDLNVLERLQQALSRRLSSVDRLACTEWTSGELACLQVEFCTNTHQQTMHGLTQIRQQVAAGGARLLGSPALQTQYQWWPTRIDRDLLPWGIETRTATEWIERFA